MAGWGVGSLQPAMTALVGGRENLCFVLWEKRRWNPGICLGEWRAAVHDGAHIPAV